jgi:hypothetical protein
MFAEGFLRRGVTFVGTCGGVLFVAMMLIVMLGKGSPSDGASPASHVAVEKGGTEKPKSDEGPVAQVNGKPIIRLAGDDWCMLGRGHQLVSLIHDATQTEFICVDQAANYKLAEGRFTDHDKILLNGKVGVVQPGGKKIVFNDGSYLVRRAEPDLNLSGYYKTGNHDGSEVAIIYQDATGAVVRTADGKEAEIVWGEYRRFSAPALGLEGVIEDRNTLVFVPLNNNPARTIPNAQVWTKSVVKLPARPAAVTKPK